MAETFTGKLEWITFCGNIDVRHPDGRLIRCYGMSPEHSKEADRLRKKAFCTVVIPDDIPGRGKFSPHITAVSDTLPPQSREVGQ